ncbi:MAG TPA: hypothetical protein ENK18_21700 [Deltaproteobacteria bacterium]|nr:hypothetical protein [Deltaproteobacteria bacterium]
MFRWLAVTTLVIGCSGVVPGMGGPEDTCDLSFDTLAGRSFVMLEARPEGDRRNPLARVQFFEQDGETRVRYTAASLSDVYEYPCALQKKGEDSFTLFCAEEAKPQDWCQALLAGDATCSKKVLRDFGAVGTDEELNTAIKEAKKLVKKYRGTPSWDRFVLNNNNLANKLQGRLYVDIDEKRCRLSVGDYYWTIFNGKPQEDTNPVGQNPFVETEESYLFEHCVEGNIMPGLASEARPSKEEMSQIPGQRSYDEGKPYWFHYLGEKNLEAEEGCTYSYDVWANWKKVSEGNTIEPVDGKLEWKFQHTPKGSVTLLNNNKPLEVITMIRYKECGGTKEQLDVVCEAGLASGGGAPEGDEAAPGEGSEGEQE